MTRVLFATAAFLGMFAVTLTSVVGAAGNPVAAVDAPTVQVYSNPG